MDIATAISGVLTESSALQQEEGRYLPSYISEHMYILMQYNNALDICLAEEEKKYKLREAELFKEYTAKGDSTNKAQTKIKYELAADDAQLEYLKRLVRSSWSVIGAAQSRTKHLIDEAKNTI